jgi:hypothetical protein
MATVPHSNDESDFPAAWLWETDGAAEGVFVRMDAGPTAFGRRPIVVLEVAGVERSVWVNTAALRSKLVEELRRRKARDFNPGERVLIRRGAEKKTSAADRDYWPFFVNFPDAPGSDAAGMLGADDQEDDEAEEGDGDIPF